MKEKYANEQFPRWFIFGEQPGGAIVDVSNGEMDVLTRVPRAQALLAIQEHNRVAHALAQLAVKFAEVAHDEFAAFWYNNPRFGK